MRWSPRFTVAGSACFVLLLAACSGTPEQSLPPETTSTPSASAAESTAPSTSLPGTTDSTTDSGTVPDVEPTVDPVPLGELTDVPGQILFLDSDGQVVVADPDGTSALVLSEAGTSNSQPTWSTSGDRVAWSGFGADGSTLVTAQRDGSEVQSISTISPAFYLSWSPDDTWIGGLRPTSTGMEMFVANPDLGAERQVSMSQPFYFDWANDDAIVAYLNNQLLVDISASDAVSPLRRPLINPLGAFQAPTVLPDGDVLGALFIESSNSLVRLNGTEIVEEVATANGPMFIAASPDGQRVAVLVPPFAGGQQEPQSEVISFQFDEPIELDNGRVTIIDLETGDVDVQPDELAVSMSWSPDGDSLAILSARNGGLRWSFTTPEGRVDGARFVPSTRFSQSYLPFFDQYNLSSTPWAPDGEAIVFSGSIGDDTGVFVDLIADDLGPALVADGDIAFWSPN